MNRLSLFPLVLTLCVAGFDLHASSWTEGGKDVLVLDCYYSDTSPSSITTADVNNRFRIGQSGGLDDLMRTDSFGRSWYNSVEHVKVQLPGPKSDYAGDGYLAYSHAVDSASNSPSSYDLILTIAPGTVTGATAYGFLGSSRSHYNSLPSTRIAHHEIMHNMGLNHAERWETYPEPRAADGSSVEYGDSNDVLGGNGPLNAYYKRRLDWLKEANGEVAEAANGNTYRIYDHTNGELSPSGTELRVVRVPIEGNMFIAHRQFWLSYTYEQGDEEMRNGLQIHTSRQANNDRSHRIDMSPGDHLSSDVNGAREDILSAELAIGRTYTDTPTATDNSHPGVISITPIAKGSTSGVNWIDVVVHSEAAGVNSPPTGGAISGPSTANTGQSVALTASATDANGDTLAYYWDFDDGTFSTDNAAVQNKSWANPGYYLVTVTVSDRRGGSTTAQQWINVGGQTSRAPENDPVVGGVFYEYFEGIFTVLPDFDQLLPDGTGTISTIGIPGVARDDDFALRLTGYIDVPATDIYRFVLRSEDGSRLSIGDSVVVNNLGERKSPADAEGNIALDAGRHAITVEMHHRSGSQHLSLKWQTANEALTEVSSGNLAGRDWGSNTVPAVTMTNPADGGSIDLGTSPTFSVTATDADGIDVVQFFLNGSYLGEDSSAPYELGWEASFAGTFDLTVKAIDTTGRFADRTHSFTVVAPEAKQVAINFAGSEDHGGNTTNPLSPGDEAGAVFLNANWNNFIESTALTDVSLHDQEGYSSPLRVSQWSGYKASGGPQFPTPAYNSEADTSTANGRMMRGLNYRRRDQDNGSQPYMTFDRIPYQEYEVFVYFDYSETDGTDTSVQEFSLESLDVNQESPASIFGKSSLTAGDGIGDYPTYDTWTNFKESTATSGSAPNSELLGNYVRFRGQYAHSFKLMVKGADGRYLNGVQIVEASPTIPRVHIVGGATEVTLAEGGTAHTYEAVLTVQPSSPVAVTIDAPNGLKLDTYLLYFTASNWNIPQAVTIYPEDNSTLDGNQILNLVHQPGGGNYASAPATELPINLMDDESASVAVSIVGSPLLEAGSSTATYRIVRTGGDLTAPLTVDFSMGGTAANDGSDYAISGTGVSFDTGSGTGSITIPADTAVGEVVISPTDDGILEPRETARLTVVTASAYSVGSPDSAALDIVSTPTGASFTEEFGANEFDLNGKSILFTPDGSADYFSAEVSDVSSFFSSSSGHTEYVSSTRDDSSYAVSLSANYFGVIYNQFFIGTNGYITFDAADADRLESAADHFDQLRISMIFTDMYSILGTTSIKAGRSGSGADARTVITVLQLEEFQFGGGNPNKIDYQVELFDDNRIRLTWLNATIDDTALVGLSNGPGPVPVDYSSVDLSALTPGGSSPNSAPFFSSTPKVAGTTGQTYSLNVLATDYDGDSLTLTAPTKPAWLTLSGTDNGSATLSGTPSASGTYPVVLEVSDGTAVPVQQSFSIEVYDPLPTTAPSGLGAAAVSTSQIDLSWTDNSGDETGFIIQRSTTSGSGFSSIHTTASDATSYSDTGLDEGTTYYYQVLATNGAGDSASTSEASATTWTAAEGWRDQYFGQIAHSGNAADDFDFDKDGLVNLLERAFGTDPTDNSDGYRPAMGTTNVDGSDYLAITYRRLKDGSGTTGVDYTVDGMTYTVEYDDDLAPPWSSGSVVQVGDASDNGDGTETVTVRLTTSMDGVTNYFIWLKMIAE